ncbi:MAG: 23S rRNA (adenine(2503)-C(2))-methyltransferase RlmN [Candidatus Dormibacteria bacterium]
MAPAELESRIIDLGQPRYRATQLLQQARRPESVSFSEMATLPRELRRRLAAEVSFISLEPVLEEAADRDLTRKLLLRCHDGSQVETVLIRHPGDAGGRPRTTVCVSSQVGCALGCVFCATGQLGLRRNLEVAEIVDQVRVARRRSTEAGWGPPDHVVFMGMGEPLQNYEPVVESIRLLPHWGVSARRVVVSTSGLVPRIDRLAQEGLPVRLALSLHAATDALRDRLVPLNRRYPVGELLAAAQRYRMATGRRVSLEYVLIAGVNDREVDAHLLRRLAAGIQAHVNLIPMNPIPHSPLRSPDRESCRRFAALVGPRASLRFSRGLGASAACGQLQARMLAPPMLQLRSSEPRGTDRIPRPQYFGPQNPE